MDNINPSKDILLSLVSLLENRKYEEVFTETNKLLKEFNNSFYLYNILGLANANTKKFDDAVIFYQKSIELNNNYPDAYNNLGLTYFEIGNLNLAINNFKKAISLNKNFNLAYTNLAKLYYIEMDFSNSFYYLHKSLLINPNYLDSLILLKNLMCLGLIFHKNDIFLYNPIINLITKYNLVQPREISVSVINLLYKDPYLNELLNCNNFDNLDLLNTLKTLNQNNLLVEFIKVCPLSNTDFENLLTIIRKKILFFNFSESDYNEIKEFILALSEQCFLNEYIYDVSLKEKNEILEIENKIIDHNNKNITYIEADVTKLSLYKNLPEEMIFTKIKKNTLNIFLKKINDEICIEKKLKKEIPVLGKIRNTTSNLVKKQYEENPYPRWFKTALVTESLSIRNFFKKIGIKLPKLDEKLFEHPEILVAGCGTGQHSINTCSIFKNSKVTAIDLSLNSLAYAKRKCQEFKIENINLFQCDILDIELLNKKFDIIESVGVIHHMKNPLEGLKILAKILNEGGLIKLGLYSKLGRKNILKFIENDLINKNDFSIENLKNNRKIIKCSDSLDIKSIMKYNDFYTLSEFRDMIFHVQEHNFDIRQIFNILEDVGLTFCGFSNLSAHILKKVNIERDSLNSLSLLDWEKKEKEHPYLFSGMYQFWCQK